MEVGYTSETRYDEKLQENVTQHGKLQRALLSVGFEVSILPVILGKKRKKERKKDYALQRE